MDGVSRRGTLVAGGAALTDEAGKVSLDWKQTLDALSCAKALHPLIIGGTLSWGDPSNKAFAAADISLYRQHGHPYYDSYRGPATAASSAVAANDTLVDMFASVATGNATPEAAVKQASRQAARYLKG